MQPDNVLYVWRLKLNSYAKTFILNSCLLSICPAHETNKLFLFGKISWCFSIILLICLMHSFFSLSITVMINILPKITKTLDEEVWTTINLYWFYNKSIEKNNSVKPVCSANQLTGFYMMGTLVVKRLNKPWIVGKIFVISLVN